MGHGKGVGMWVVLSCGRQGEPNLSKRSALVRLALGAVGAQVAGRAPARAPRAASIVAPVLAAARAALLSRAGVPGVPTRRSSLPLPQAAGTLTLSAMCSRMPCWRYSPVAIQKAYKYAQHVTPGNIASCNTWSGRDAGYVWVPTDAYQN